MCIWPVTCGARSRRINLQPTQTENVWFTKSRRFDTEILKSIKAGKIGNFEQLINEGKMWLQRCDLGCHYNILIKLTYVKCLPFMLSVVLPGFAQTQSWRAPDPEVCLRWLRHKTTGSAEWQQCCRLVSPFTSTKWLMKDSAIAPFLLPRILWLIMIDNFTNCPVVIMIRTDQWCLIVHLHQQGSILEPSNKAVPLIISDLHIAAIVPLWSDHCWQHANFIQVLHLQHCPNQPSFQWVSFVFTQKAGLLTFG